MQPVPPQQKGGSSDTELQVICDTEDQAQQMYQQAKKRLQDVNHWGNISKGISARFFLCDPSGKPVARAPRKNDYFKIDLPGPGTVKGNGFDWVRVELVEENIFSENHRRFNIRVRSSPAPQQQRQQDPAHFFEESATSSFIVEQKGLLVTAAVRGRNEVPNKKAGNILDKIRNLFTGTAAIAGISKIQWKKLVKAVLRTN